MENDDFCVERRVCVDMSKIRATKKLSRGFEAHSINLVQGNYVMIYYVICWDVQNHLWVEVNLKI